jgi:hypothetical protein
MLAIIYSQKNESHRMRLPQLLRSRSPPACNALPALG